MTTAKKQLIQELEQTLDFLVQEVLDFPLFIKVRLQHRVQEDQANNSHEVPRLPLFLQFVEEISAQVSREAWEKLPRDLSKNIDHYLYGSPKDEE